jgi:tetratricopeptide (TPR) repeat protein
MRLVTTCLLLGLLTGCVGKLQPSVPAKDTAPSEPGQASGPGSFLKVYRQATEKTGNREWKDAAELWEQVVQMNPVRGSFWQQLATARYNAKEYRKAIPAFEKTLELGLLGFPADSAYGIARCYAQLGENAEALQWLEKAFDMGYRRLRGAQTDAVFQPLHADERFRKLVALLDTGKLSRAEGWRYDLQLLAREVKRQGYAPFRKTPHEQFEAEVRRIHAAIPRLTDVQVAIEFIKLAARVGDGHTWVGGFSERPDLRPTIPVEWYQFQEGVFITIADPRYQDLLGARVRRLGDRTVEEVLRALDSLVQRDNEMGPKIMGLMLMRHPSLLHGLGLIPAADKVTLTVTDRQGKARTVTLAADSVTPSRRLWDALPDGWASYHQTLPGPVPLYLKNPYADYWFEHLVESKTVYFQFNRVRNDPREPLSQFCDRLFKFVNEHEVEKLVLDIRWNNGGDTTILTPLIHGLIRAERINQRGKLFVVIGRRTFSAAQNAATYIERNSRAIFVGEPTGSSPNFVGEETIFELPYSKLLANVSDLYWQSSWPDDHRTWIAPLLYAPPTFAAYGANRDPALEAVAAYWEGH